ncbi:MFS transporter [Zavarzinia compransoris]|uniref:MFS transporter n=1 Tax=Zavarzinia compransoris TaxID=1264899 RepID=A0A317EAM3_9PROT|nr:MFS transporter [Zavarzinia compransoris]PWR23200.1 MFS transporter [Zavarzinia compransoris]TDP46241.1 DHA1 family inner membrane transport protein [Zavarzinia compransoris]
MPLPLLALAIASFGIGTTEFVIMGLLLDVSRDLGVSVPQAGLLVSGYALGVAVGSPILALATARMPRRQALIGLMGIFIAGNLACALAPDYGSLMAARVLTSFCHGAFFGLGAVVAGEVVPPERQARAIAMMFAGLTLANVLGVPFGTALGQAFGWRSTFVAVVGIGLVAALALHVWLPRNLSVSTGSLLREVRSLGRVQVFLAMAISVLASASLFSVFTYIAPILETVTRIEASTVTYVLLVFGVGLTLGNFLGGRLADWRLMPTVIGCFIAAAAVLGLFLFTSAWFWPAVATVFVWGAIVFALVAPLQMRVVNEASGAPNLASTLNQGAFNLGNASGAWIGGVAIDRGLAYADMPAIGIVLALAALALTLWSYALDRRQAGLAPKPARSIA